MEGYVTFEVAKLLKEKGYNEPCDRFFAKLYDYKEVVCGMETRFSKVTYNELENKDILRPSLYGVAKWLREKHNIWIYVYPEYHQIIEYRVRIITFDDLLENNKSLGTPIPLWFEKYEEAFNEGIKKALKFI